MEFKTRNQYEKDLEKVYKFHQRCLETVLDHIKSNGPIVIPDDELQDWRFKFIEYESVMQVYAIGLTDDEDFVEFACADQNGDPVFIPWDQMNHDMTITEMVMEKVFEK